MAWASSIIHKCSWKITNDSMAWTQGKTFNVFFRRLSFYKPCNFLWRFVNRKKIPMSISISHAIPGDFPTESFWCFLWKIPKRSAKYYSLVGPLYQQSEGSYCFFLLKLAITFCQSQEKPNVNFFITRNSGRFPRWVLLIFVVWKNTSVGAIYKVHIFLVCSTSITS